MYDDRGSTLLFHPTSREDILLRRPLTLTFHTRAYPWVLAPNCLTRTLHGDGSYQFKWLHELHLGTELVLTHLRSLGLNYMNT